MHIFHWETLSLGSGVVKTVGRESIILINTTRDCVVVNVLCAYVYL